MSEHSTHSIESDHTVIISPDTGFQGYKLRNFYITNGLQGFIWMLFHFSVVYFFTILLNNIILVGIFLGFANAVAFVVDIPLGILQKYISTKKFFIYGAISQLIAVGIFLLLISQVFSLLHTAGGVITPDFLESASEWFFGNAINIIAILIAAICYGITKEMNEVSTFGYILSNSNPSEYGVILSRSNITFGIGSFLWLVLSGGLLSLPSGVSLIILGAIIAGFMVFTIRYFDNSLDSFTADNIKQFKVSLQKFNIERVREQLSDTIKATDLASIVQSTKYIFLKPKPVRQEGEKIPWKSLIRTTIEELKVIWSIISSKPLHYSLIWGLTLVLIFGFWDTFATSFLIDYLEEIQPGGSYILLAIIGVPGIILQESTIKLSQKIGVKAIGIIGISLSTFSLFLITILSLGEPPSAWTMVGVALINSIGYACGMAIGQMTFLDMYNRVYAQNRGLKEIDSNASAGPMKVVQNLANVFGLVFGGALLVLGFSFFFFVFGAVIAAFLVWTIRKRAHINA